MLPLYEGSHIIIVSKWNDGVVRGGKTGDKSLPEIVKQYTKEKYHKPGNVFLGMVHRFDRPIWGFIVFAKTLKALTRFSKMFKEGQVHKTHWVITRSAPPAGEGVLTDWLMRNERQNKSYARPQGVPNAKKAVLEYRVIAHSDYYRFMEMNLLTGRHHQIRCQLANMGCVIKDDLECGVSRSNPDGSTSLLARRIMFVYLISKENIVVEAPLSPSDELWEVLTSVVIP